MTWDQWVILLCGPTAVFLAMSRHAKWRLWSPAVGMFGQLGWWWALSHPFQPGALLASVAYTYAWGLGLYNYRREYECLLKSWIGPFTAWLRHEASVIARSL